MDVVVVALRVVMELVLAVLKVDKFGLASENALVVVKVCTILSRRKDSSIDGLESMVLILLECMV